MRVGSHNSISENALVAKTCVVGRKVWLCCKNSDQICGCV